MRYQVIKAYSGDDIVDKISCKSTNFFNFVSVSISVRPYNENVLCKCSRTSRIRVNWETKVTG